MSYGLLLTAEAEADLRKLPGPVLEEALRHLDALAEYPSLLSRQSYFPYWHKSQLFQFDVEHAAFRWELTVLFQYAQDEQSLHILAIGQLWRDRDEANRLYGPPS